LGSKAAQDDEIAPKSSKRALPLTGPIAMGQPWDSHGRASHEPSNAWWALAISRDSAAGILDFEYYYVFHLLCYPAADFNIN
jgi:hypothetical protein